MTTTIATIPRAIRCIACARYHDPADREIAGFCAAALAFGRVASVLNSIDTLFAIMGPHPAAFVRAFEPAAPHPELRAMVHRWIRGGDLVALLWILRQMLERSGSIEAFFLEGDDAAAPDVSTALDSFSRGRWRSTCSAPTAVSRRRAGVCYFFPRPSAGSACKRLNLFLRWMVRRDEVDLGVWTRLRAGAPDRAARHPRHSPRPLPAVDALRQPRVEDGRRHHRLAAPARSGRSGALRLLDLPRRHDERLRLRQETGRFAMSAQRLVPAARARRVADGRAARRVALGAGGLALAQRQGEPPPFRVLRGASPDRSRIAIAASSPAPRRRRASSCDWGRREKDAVLLQSLRRPQRATRSSGRRTATASASSSTATARLFDAESGKHAGTVRPARARTRRRRASPAA